MPTDENDNPPHPQSEEYVEVTVKRQHAYAVYALVTELDRSNEQTPKSTADHRSGDVSERTLRPQPGRRDEAGLSREDVADLWARCNQRTRAIMSRIAEATKRHAEVSYGELLETARPFANDPHAYAFSNLRADLAWISKHSNRIKPGAAWPLNVRQVASADEGGRILYTMAAAIAASWLEIAAGS